MRLLRPLAEALHLGENLVGGLGPLERLAELVVHLYVLTDRVAQLRQRGVRPALKRLLCEKPKEAFDEIEPRRVGGREMKEETRMAQQPPVHGWRFVGREVVEHNVDREARFNGTVD